MIHLNLIEAAERVSMLDNVNAVHVTDLNAAEVKSKKKHSMIAAAVVVAALGFSAYISSCGVPVLLQGMLPKAYLDLIGAEDPTYSDENQDLAHNAQAMQAVQAKAEEAVLKMRDGMTVKQVVGEVNPKALFNNNRTNYDSYLPMEKISYLRSATSQFLSFLTTATPDDVGFSDCIFQAPNYFYIRGVSAKPTSQRSFLERVKAVSADFRTPALPENAPATDITAFGLFNVSANNLNAVTKFVTSAEVAEEIKTLKTLATTNNVTISGMEKPSVEDFGVYKRYTYQTTIGGDYPNLQAFATALAASPIRLGITKLEMHLAKRDLSTNARFVMFVVP